MDEKMIKYATHIYLSSYMEALNITKNQNVAVQCALGVTAVLVNKPKTAYQLGTFITDMIKEAKKSDRSGKSDHGQKEDSE